VIELGVVVMLDAVVLLVVTSPLGTLLEAMLDEIPETK
jgi:Flp pilus assembly pilin Flp